MALRFGPHDARLARGEHELTAGEVGLPVRVIDAEFGGRHRHFTVEAGGTLLRLSMLRDDPGSWTRAVAIGRRGGDGVLAGQGGRVRGSTRGGSAHAVPCRRAGGESDVTAAAPATMHPRALGWERRAVVRVVAGTGFLLVVGYLVVAPLVQLQMMAFTGGADDGFAAAFGRPEFVRTILHTVGLAAGSLLIGLVLGTLLAWASSRLPRTASVDGRAAGAADRRAGDRVGGRLDLPARARAGLPQRAAAAAAVVEST